MVSAKQKTDWAEVRRERDALLHPVSEPAAVAVLDDEPAAVELTPASAPGTPPEARRRSLAEKYRPRRLADLAGQPEAVAEVRKCLAAPRSKPLLLTGASGIGKTSMAYAIAGELGCDLDGWAGGYTTIASGEHTADTLREVWDSLWTIPFTGSGWRVLCVNETETLNPAVEKLWMDKLENLPPKCIVVFTSNSPDTLARRFRSRCRVIEFKAAAGDLDDAARELLARVWTAETGGECPRDVADRIVRASIERGELSFREVVEATEEEIERTR